MKCTRYFGTIFKGVGKNTTDTVFVIVTVLKIGAWKFREKYETIGIEINAVLWLGGCGQVIFPNMPKNFENFRFFFSQRL